MTGDLRIAGLALPPEPDGGPRLDVTERDRVVRYLESGVAILFTTATAPDRYDPPAGEPVGLSVRSDGDWVWSDAITYYLRTYGIGPEPDLYRHIRANRYVCPLLDAAAAADALARFHTARG